MGTRHLIAVVADGEYKVAQYGQWDGYPEGQGVTALVFCREHLATPESRDAFTRKLAIVRFSGDANELQSTTFMRSRMNYTTERTESEPYPYAGRDNGAEILRLLHEAPDGQPVYLANSIGFAADVVSCEWAYVVDLDRGVLDVYEGGFRVGDGVARAGFPTTFSLDDLPSNDDFVARCERKDKAS